MSLDSSIKICAWILNSRFTQIVATHQMDKQNDILINGRPKRSHLIFVATTIGYDAFNLILKLCKLSSIWCNVLQCTSIYGQKFPWKKDIGVSLNFHLRCTLDNCVEWHENGWGAGHYRVYIRVIRLNVRCYPINADRNDRDGR